MNALSGSKARESREAEEKKLFRSSKLIDNRVRRIYSVCIVVVVSIARRRPTVGGEGQIYDILGCVAARQFYTPGPQRIKVSGACLISRGAVLRSAIEVRVRRECHVQINN